MPDHRSASSPEKTQAAPGAVDLAEFSLFFFPVLNDAGDVAFQASLRTGDAPGAGVVDDLNNEAIFGPTAGAGSPLGILAREGQAAPGADDLAEFDFLVSPVLNDAGDVAFFALLRTGDAPGAGSVDGSNNQAIFGPTAGAGSPLGIVAREDQAAPGADDLAELSSFSGLPVLNAAGDVAFQALLRTGDAPGAGSVDSSNNNAIFGPTAGAGSPLGLVARAGQAAPEADDLAEFSVFGPPVLNAAGDVAFQALLRTGDAPGAGSVDFSNDNAIFGPTAGAGSPLGLLAREDQAAPGADDLAEFSVFGPPVLNAAGDVAFLAGLRTGDAPGAGIVDSSNDSGLFAFIDGELELVARTGDLFEVLDPDTLTTELRTISSTAFDDFNGFNGFNGFNDAGELAFGLSFTDGTSGIFTASFAAVPEPSTAVLALLAAAGFARRRRR